MSKQVRWRITDQDQPGLSVCVDVSNAETVAEILSLNHEAERLRELSPWLFSRQTRGKLVTLYLSRGVDMEMTEEVRALAGLMSLREMQEAFEVVRQAEFAWKKEYQDRLSKAVKRELEAELSRRQATRSKLTDAEITAIAREFIQKKLFEAAPVKYGDPAAGAGPFSSAKL